jgi:hypothetical protein
LHIHYHPTAFSFSIFYSFVIDLIRQSRMTTCSILSILFIKWVCIKFKRVDQHVLNSLSVTIQRSLNPFILLSHFLSIVSLTWTSLSQLFCLIKVDENRNSFYKSWSCKDRKKRKSVFVFFLLQFEWIVKKKVALFISSCVSPYFYMKHIQWQIKKLFLVATKIFFTVSKGTFFIPMVWELLCTNKGGWNCCDNTLLLLLYSKS